MVQIALIVLLTLGLPCLAGCAGSAGSSGSSEAVADPAGMTGDERGGKIPGGVGGPTAQASAYELVNAHCAKYGKKGFITRMDFETGTMTFECRQQKAKPGA